MTICPTIRHITLVAMLVLLFVGGCKMEDDSKMNLDDESISNSPIDPDVTQELFLIWRSPRFGKSNPEQMTNPVWVWLAKSRINAYLATELLKGTSAMDSGPGWCFDRFGQTSTKLPDGRIVFIAGEHEDHYDPDFYIYNDVVIQSPDGRIDIFGYPREVFPPTDFHSATLIDNQIILIGNLGYPEDRCPGHTPVMLLDLKTLAVSTVTTSGTPPGWIHKHKATLSRDGRSILVQRGTFHRGGKDASLIENIDNWRLNLSDWRWERLTERRWPRWEVCRKDGERNHLFEYQQSLWEKDIPALKNPDGDLAQIQKKFEIPTLAEYLGKQPDLDLFQRLYKPAVAFEEVAAEEDDEYGVRRINLGGIIVRYVDDGISIQLTVEGELPKRTLDTLTSDLLKKFSTLENAECELIEL